MITVRQHAVLSEVFHFNVPSKVSQTTPPFYVRSTKDTVRSLRRESNLHKPVPIGNRTQAVSLTGERSIIYSIAPFSHADTRVTV